MTFEEYIEKCEDIQTLTLEVEDGPIGGIITPSYKSLGISTFQEWEDLDDEERSNRLKKVW